MLKKKTIDMTAGNSLSELIRFTIPLILGNVFQLAYNTVDTVVVGRFAGKSSLAAVGTCDPVMNLLIMGVSGVCVGASVLMSEFFGAGETEKVKDELKTTLSIGMIFAFAMLLAGALGSRTILRLISVPEEVIPEASQYLAIILIGMPFTCLYNIYAAAMRSIGDSATPVRYLILSNLLNMALDLLLVAGFHMGVCGAGLATTLSEAVSALLCIRYAVKHMPLLSFEWRKLSIDKELAKKTLSYGGLTALQQCAQPIGKVFIQRTVNTLGVSAIAAFNAVGKVEDIGLVPGRSISNSIMTFVAQNRGAKNGKRAEKGFWQGMFMELASSLCVCLLIAFLMRPLMHLFSDDEEIIAEGIRYFLFARFMYWLPHVTNGVQGYFRGMGKMRTVLAGTITQISIRVFTTILFAPSLGILSVAVGCACGWSAMLAWELPYQIYTGRRLLKEGT